MTAFIVFVTVSRGNVSCSEKQHYFPDCQLSILILELVELVYRGNYVAKTNRKQQILSDT